MTDVMTKLNDILEQKVPGFKACFGGEELNRASASLSGALVGGSSSITDLSDDLSGLTLEMRELVFAAKQYASVSGSTDFDHLYNHALVLQELAGKMAPGSTEQVNLLNKACDEYSTALSLHPAMPQALYNHGVALADLAHCLKDSDPALSTAHLHGATQQYADTVRLRPRNVQALINWGLVLQDLMVLAKGRREERQQLFKFAVEKFRHAIRLRPDFDRGVYNLGRAFYSHASVLESEMAMSANPGSSGTASSPVTPTPPSLNHHFSPSNVRIPRHQVYFATAAQYIAIAHVLHPSSEVYARSFKVVRDMLPLPHLRAGYLLTPTGSTHDVSCSWRREWCVLDSLGLKGVPRMDVAMMAVAGARGPSHGGGTDSTPLHVDIREVVDVRRVWEPSLPEGHGLWMELEHEPQGLYLVAEDPEAADGWADALLLVRSLHRCGLSDLLTQLLAPPALGAPSRHSLKYHMASDE